LVASAEEHVKINFGDLVKRPDAALRFTPRHCSVPQKVRFIPRYSRALPATFLRGRLKIADS